MNKTSRVKKYFSDRSNYIESNPIIALRERILYNLIGEVKGKEIIDIGCGNGELTRDYISDNSVTFLDFSEEMISLAKSSLPDDKKSNADFIISDILNYNTEKTFDIVICIGVIAHIENIDSLINKLKNLTSPGGIIVIQYSAAEKFITFLNRIKKSVFFRRYQNQYRVNVTSSADIRKILAVEQLDIIKKIPYVPVSPFFSLFSYEKKIRYMKYFYRCKLFSFLGSEIILVVSNQKRNI